MPDSDIQKHLSHLLKQLGVAALYALFIYLDHRYFEIDVVSKAPFEPASGLALAVLLIGGRRYAWGVLLGSFLINITEAPFLVAVITSTTETLQALCGAWLLTHNNKFDPALRSLRAYLRLILLGGVVSTGIAANIGSAALLASGFIRPEAYLHESFHWWRGDLLGVILVAPLILICGLVKNDCLETRRMGEAALLLGLTLLAGQVIFLGWFHDSIGDVAMGYWMFMLITWVAVRLGAHGTVIAMNTIGIQALLGAVHGAGFFANDLDKTHLANYWFYMASLSMVGMALAIFLDERKRAEKALRQSELKFRTLYESTTDAVHLMDETGFMDCNKATLAMCGCATKEEFCSKSPVDFSPPEQPCGTNSKVLTERYIATAMETGSHRFDWVCKRFDNGKLFNIDVQLTAMKLDGKPVFLVVARDITERKTAETALRQSELKFRTLYESTSDAVHLLDETGFIDCNKASLEIIGCATKEEFCKKSPVDLAPPKQPCGTSSQELAKQHIATAMENGSHRFNWVCKRLDNGRLVYVDVQLAVMELGGKPIIHVVSRDITEKRLAEIELARSETKYRMLYDSTSEAMMLMDEKGFLDCNNATLAMFGCTSKEVFCSYHPADLSPQEQQCGANSLQLANQYIATALEKGHYRFEWMCKRIDNGKIFFAEILLNIMKLEGEIFLQVIARDITEQKLAREEFERFFNLIPDMACIASTDGYFKKINRAWQTTLGYTEQELLSTPFIEFIHPEDIDATMQEVERQLAGGKASRFSNRYRCKEGSYKLLEWDMIPPVDGTLLYGSARDVTEQKRAEEELNRFFDLVPDLVCIASTEGRFLRINRAWQATLGYTEQEILATPFIDLIHPDDREATMKEVERQLAGKATMQFSNRYRCKDGSCRWLEWEATPAIDKSLLFASARDVTERKRVEAALRESEERLRGIMNNTSAVIFMKDVDGRYLLVNSQYEKLFHISNAAIQGKTDHDFFPEEMADALVEADRKAIRAGQSIEMEERVPHDDGVHTYISVKFPLRNASGEVYAVCGIATDITERKAAEQQLHELARHIQDVREEEKTRIAREIHDELGGTLTALKMDVHWLSRKLPVNEEFALLERIQAMSHRIDETITVTRRIITDLRPSIVDDLGLLPALEWQAAEFCERTGIECRVSCIENEADLDKQRSIALFRILQEALTNVSLHSGATEVRVEFFHGENQVKLTVSDNGCGIQKKHVATSKSYGMLGMIERVEQLGGKIIFFNQPEGGLCVEVILPLPIVEGSL